MEKRGQLQMSFGMIFSIFIIIVTVAVAVYVIRNFMNTQECVSIEMFYDKFDKEVDSVWKSPRAQKTFEEEVTRNIEAVCFGDPSKLDKTKYSKEYNALKGYSSLDKNIFLYPPVRSCDSRLLGHKTEHIVMKEPFCIKTKSGEASVKLLKNSSSEKYVTVTP